MTVHPFQYNQECESKQLTPIELTRPAGNPIYWPEFIENFKPRVHFKSSFKGTVMQIEKALINDPLRVSKVS